MIEHRQRLYAAGAFGILAFLVAQTFQELAYALSATPGPTPTKPRRPTPSGWRSLGT
jgi:hypothetical protein